MRVLFAGSPNFAAFILHALLKEKQEIVAVLTQPDRPCGRGLQTKSNEVKTFALENKLPVLQFSTLKVPEALNAIRVLAPDIIVVVAYGLIIPPSILNLPKYGCINIHASLLPRWRGAAPIQRAIEAGDQESGISIMCMDEGLDTGDVLMQESVLIHANETAFSLHERLKVLGAELSLKVLNMLPHLQAQAQKTTGVTYAHKINKKESLIDWSQPALQLERKIRAFNPVPVASCRWQGQILKIWQAKAVTLATHYPPGQVISGSEEGLLLATGEGGLLIQELQLAGRKRQHIATFIKGYPQLLGSQLR